jgi:hypothetical protein
MSVMDEQDTAILYSVWVRTWRCDETGMPLYCDENGVPLVMPGDDPPEGGGWMVNWSPIGGDVQEIYPNGRSQIFSSEHEADDAVRERIAEHYKAILQRNVRVERQALGDPDW